MLCSCSDHRAARIVVPAETLTVNTTVWTDLGVRVVTRDGGPAREPMTFQSADTALLTARAGAVSCHDDGTTDVRIATSGLQATVQVRCHLVRRFGPPRTVLLTVGDPPVPFEIEAYDGAGRLMRGARLRVTVRDTAIIRMRDGMVTGLRPGGASIGAHSSGRSGGTIYWVRGAPSDVESLSVRKPGAGGRPVP